MVTRSVLVALGSIACGSARPLPATSGTVPPAAVDAPGESGGSGERVAPPLPETVRVPPPVTPSTGADSRVQAEAADRPLPAGSLRLNNTWPDCVKGFVEA